MATEEFRAGRKLRQGTAGKCFIIVVQTHAL